MSAAKGGRVAVTALPQAMAVLAFTPPRRAPLADPSPPGRGNRICSEEIGHGDAAGLPSRPLAGRADADHKVRGGVGGLFWVGLCGESASPHPSPPRHALRARGEGAPSGAD